MNEQKLEENELHTARIHSQGTYKVSEAEFDAIVAYFSEEAYLIDFDADELDAMCKEFLRFVTGTYYTRIETSVGWLYMAYSGHRLQFLSVEEEAIFLEKAEHWLGTRPLPDEENHLPKELIECVKAAIESHVIYGRPIDLSHISNFETTILEHAHCILSAAMYSL